MTASIRPVEISEFELRARRTYGYLNQGKVWVPKDRPALPIADMDGRWRANAARWMERRAAAFERLYTFGEIFMLSRPTMREVITEIGGVAYEAGPLFSHLDLMGEHAQDAFDAEQEHRTADPAAWIRSTPLYRAIVAGLPAEVSA